MHPFIPSATPSVFTMFDLFRPAKEKRGAELCDGSPFDRLQFYVAAPVGLGGFLERLDSKEKREISDGCTPERNFSGSMKPAEEEGRFEEQIPFFPNMHVGTSCWNSVFRAGGPQTKQADELASAPRGLSPSEGVRKLQVRQVNNLRFSASGHTGGPFCPVRVVSCRTVPVWRLLNSFQYHGTSSDRSSGAG